jgi:hypothetical protein
MFMCCCPLLSTAALEHGTLFIFPFSQQTAADNGTEVAVELNLSQLWWLSLVCQLTFNLQSSSWFPEAHQEAR